MMYPREMVATLPLAWRARAVDYVELLKPRIMMLVLTTVAVGYVLGATGPVDVPSLVRVVLGVCLVGGGAAILNHYVERDLDMRMERTRNRPLPAGRVGSGEARAVGVACLAVGVGWLWVWVNPLTALLGAGAASVYVFVYTAMKLWTPLNTLVGAVVGALPPVMGWAGATGELSIGAWCLFAVVFAWQLPHFFAIAWYHREDYLRAGMKMAGILDASGWTTSLRVTLFCLALLPVSLLPTVAGTVGMGYLIAALVLGLVLLSFAIRLMVKRSSRSARSFFLCSVVYLSALFGSMTLDRLAGP